MSTTELVWNVDRGIPGVDRDMSNPLARAPRRLVDEGCPDDSLSICLYGGEESGVSGGHPVRWLGVLVRSLTAVNRRPT